MFINQVGPIIATLSLQATAQPTELICYVTILMLYIYGKNNAKKTSYHR